MSLIRLARKVVSPTPSKAESTQTQCGAIPFSVVEGEVVFLMVTSRRSANWIFPKGAPMDGLTSWETAAEEAFEEAGVRGEIAHVPLGEYAHRQSDRPAGLLRVELFPLHVTRQFDDWPEEPQRFRHWALLPQVRRLLVSKQAAGLAAELSRRITSGDYPPGISSISA